MAMTTSKQSATRQVGAVVGDLAVALVIAAAAALALLILAAVSLALVFAWSVVFSGPEQIDALRGARSGGWLLYGAQAIAAPAMVITVVVVMVKRTRRRQGWL